MKKRVFYILFTVILLAIEVLIALFVHDTFIRPYVGDVLVVIVLYTFIRCFFPDGIKLLPLYIFAFATGVEVLQYIQIVKILGLQDYPFFATLIGTTFDVKDIICYGIGCIFLGGYELWRLKQRCAPDGIDR